MSQSLAKVMVHVIYNTKNREPWLRDADLRSELYAYNATILKDDFREIRSRLRFEIDQRRLVVPPSGGIAAQKTA